MAAISVEDDPCVHCNGPIEYVRTTTRNGVMARDPAGYDPKWLHVGGGVRCPEGTPGLVPLAQPPSRCPKCRALGYTTTQEAWLDRSTCAACGHQNIYMIGD